MLRLIHNHYLIHHAGWPPKGPPESVQAGPGIAVGIFASASGSPWPRLVWRLWQIEPRPTLVRSLPSISYQPFSPFLKNLSSLPTHRRKVDEAPWYLLDI